jgi:hypothetical protein
MQANDFPQFKNVMTGMSELFQRELSNPLLDAYWLALGDWSLDEFQAAAAQLMKTEDFMPKPAAFTALRKAGRPTSGEAWAVVLEYARKGYTHWMGGGRLTLNNSVATPDSDLINRAVAAIGGYQAIAMSPTDKTSFLERRFCEHFEQMQEAEETREALPELSFDRRTALSGPTTVGNLLGRFTDPTGS